MSGVQVPLPLPKIQPRFIRGLIFGNYDSRDAEPPRAGGSNKQIGIWEYAGCGIANLRSCISRICEMNSLSRYHPSSLRSVAIGTIGRGDVILITRNGCHDEVSNANEDGQHNVLCVYPTKHKFPDFVRIYQFQQIYLHILDITLDIEKYVYMRNPFACFTL